MSTRTNTLQNWMQQRLLWLEEMGAYARMVGQSFKSLFKSPPTFSSIVHESYHIGVKSFLIVMVAALATGLVMAIQFGFGLSKFGARPYVPKITAVAIVRELGPLFAALMVAGRVGAGIAAEVGSMKVTQQIDAIRALGTDPIQKIIAPKIIAATICVPMLALVADFLGILGGSMIAPQLNLSQFDYFSKSFAIVNGRDLIGGIIKSVFFGFLVGSIGCYIGMSTTGGTQGVGNSTTRSVVLCSIMVIFFDFILTKLLWIIEHAFLMGGL